MGSMIDFRPFRGVRFSDAPDVSRKVCPPYDRIPPSLQAELHARDPLNAVRLTFPRSEPDDAPGRDRYDRATRTLRSWLQSGHIRPERSPAFYVYDVEFESRPGVRKVRRAVLGLLRLSPFSEGTVLPHEETLPGPKRDRLELLRATGGAQFGPVFLLYFRKRRLERLLDRSCERPPDASATADAAGGERHRLWVVTDAGLVASVRHEIEVGSEENRLLIADGHHRYTTALEYRDERRKEAGGVDPEASFEFRLAALVDGDSDDVVIRPTHRVVRTSRDLSPEEVQRMIAQEFELSVVPLSDEGPQALLSAMAAEREAGRRAYGIAVAGSPIAWLASRPRTSDLDDLTHLHRLIEGWGLLASGRAEAVESRVEFEKDPSRAVEAARASSGIAFLVNPLTVEEVRLAAQAGRRLPQKSTDFHPKFLSGMVMYVPDPARK
jgi:uncharacterized protein (DUF1015 family)